MVYYNAYVQLTQKDVFIVVVNEKNKNQITIIDSFQMGIKDYLNENGLIQYPLILAEDISQKINNEKYAVKDITLILSPKDTTIFITQENTIFDSKELIETANTKVETAFKKHPEAYEMAWIHTGDILDDGTPYSILLQYCYPLREVNKLKKAFSKNKIHISSVLLPEIATAALFSQYYDEYNDPTILIVESGSSSSFAAATTTYSYKRNILENIGTYKTGINTIVKEINNFYSQLSPNDITTLLFSCGAFKEYQTEDADEIFSLNNINKEEWYAVAERSIKGFAVALRNDIQRRMEKPDKIILIGALACIPGIKDYFFSKYSIICNTWENTFDMKIGQTSIIYSKPIKQSPMFATIMGAVYYRNWSKNMKKGTLSKPVLELDISKFNKFAIISCVAVALYAVSLFIPEFVNLKKLENEQAQMSAETQTAMAIKNNIAAYEQNIETQTQFLERSSLELFNMKDFVFNATLLKPKDITFISIDTPNFLEKVVDTQPYYHIKKAVEEKRKTQKETKDSEKSFSVLDISGKDWTFGLDWENVEMTTEGIKNYLEEKGISNVSPYVISKVVIRGYGSQTSIANFTKDLGGINGVYRAEYTSEEKLIPDGSGSIIMSNIFEINVWFGKEEE